ncbi:MAG: oligopeptide transport system substrate-binding protein, partial [Granulosicoccus sp.]
MNQSFKSTLYALLGSSLVLSSAIASNRVPADVKLAEDQTFTYRILDEHSSLDPQVVEDVTGSEVVRDLFEGLMSQDSEGNLIPGVATSYDVNDDNTVYTFKLRDNAKWSNGEAVTANDFV